jgi:hypothetical protein
LSYCHCEHFCRVNFDNVNIPFICLYFKGDALSNFFHILLFVSKSEMLVSMSWHKLTFMASLPISHLHFKSCRHFFQISLKLFWQITWWVSFSPRFVSLFAGKDLILFSSLLNRSKISNSSTFSVGNCDINFFNFRHRQVWNFQILNWSERDQNFTVNVWNHWKQKWKLRKCNESEWN